MATHKQVASEYAARLRAASTTTVVKKTASEGSKPTIETFSEELERIFRDVDSRVYENTQTRISDGTREEILAELDDALGLRRGTMSLVKKGSVQATINYQQVVAQLLAQVSYK
ncbi:MULTISPECIES: hypothetical protein [Sorangium]|uniref:Uncharacterized protein n=1 Tax=Sorangium cellulosum TaxID=56 RepID=A0A4P2QN65_SORCE|nr:MULTISPECIES: hypothetical protein [Sorangium]AUX31271.1 uncharacterized protein SOCE836_034000 [Sorangium cellulosum]WCQ90655.1 hypothetical protein NQZ70_03366 [Sorangium sp. Soce836]